MKVLLGLLVELAPMLTVWWWLARRSRNNKAANLGITGWVFATFGVSTYGGARFLNLPVYVKTGFLEGVTAVMGSLVMLSVGIALIVVDYIARLLSGGHQARLRTQEGTANQPAGVTPGNRSPETPSPSSGGLHH